MIDIEREDRLLRWLILIILALYFYAFIAVIAWQWWGPLMREADDPIGTQLNANVSYQPSSRPLSPAFLEVGDGKQQNVAGS